jgi:hypothetical protein
MIRRSFLKLIGAGAAATAAGLIVPDLARKFFLPPRAGWALHPSGGIQVGDVITFEGVHDTLKIRKCKQFVVTSINDRGELFIDPHEQVRYDAAWTLPDGRQEQLHLDTDGITDDKWARTVFERLMRERGATPGSTHFRLELPRNISDARYI